MRTWIQQHPIAVSLTLSALMLLAANAVVFLHLMNSSLILTLIW